MTKVLGEQEAAVEHEYDRLSGIYDDYFGHQGAKAEERVLFELAREAGCQDGRVLDLGCGTALALEHLRIEPDRYLGLDISSGMLEQARRKFPSHSFQKGDMADLGHLQAQSFDVVMSTFGSFCYNLDPWVVMAGVRKVLKPGGLLWLQLCGLRYQRRASHICRKKANGKAEPKLMVYSVDQAERLAMVGFKAVRCTGFHATSDALFNRLSRRQGERLLRLELGTVGRVVPAACYFLILSAQREEAPYATRATTEQRIRGGGQPTGWGVRGRAPAGRQLFGGQGLDLRARVLHPRGSPHRAPAG